MRSAVRATLAEPALSAPFPYFGGKSSVAAAVWERFGEVGHYVEPFFGSGAVLLGAPWPPGCRRLETVNDLDCMVANFWRATQAAPEEVARHADWPVNEVDLHARRRWLHGRQRGLRELLVADADAYDAKTAGWWVWGISQWIGGGFMPKSEAAGHYGKKPHVGGTGKGVHRESLANGKRPHLSSAGMGAHREPLDGGLLCMMQRLQRRLRRVRVCCGDWARVVTPCALGNGKYVVGVFLDPPYAGERKKDIYSHDSTTVAHDVRDWALSVGEDTKMRIALCDYDGTHDMPGWSVMQWKTQGGYGNIGDGRGRQNACRERIWFSPHCAVPPEQGEMGF